jgi:predicted metal-dependent hydrolase
MTALITESRFPDPDRAYRALIEAHRGLSDEKSAALNSSLVLILANHIGDQAVLQEAIALAKQSMEQTQSAPG